MALTEDQIDLMTPKALMEAYNAIVKDELKVKRFADRQAGQKRLRLMISAVRHDVDRFAATKEDIEGGFRIIEENDNNVEVISGEKTTVIPIMEEEVLKTLKTGRVKNTTLQTLAVKEVQRFRKEKFDKKTAPKKAKAASTDGEFLPSVAATMRKMIEDGLSNEEIWERCAPHFGLPESKKNYPSWYRAEIARKTGVKKGPKENVM
jgi:hypothetical protein